MDLTGALRHMSKKRAGVRKTGWTVLAKVMRPFSQQMSVEVAFVVRYQESVDRPNGFLFRYS